MRGFALGLLVVLALSGCASESPPGPPDDRLRLRQFEGCQIHYPDGSPIPCGTTVAVASEPSVPQGWACLGRLAAGRGAGTLWSDRQQAMGLEVAFDDAVTGTAFLDVRLAQGGTEQVAVGEAHGHAFLRLPAPTTDAGQVRFQAWTFRATPPPEAFAVEVSSFEGQPWYSYGVTFNGTLHHFARMDRHVVDGAPPEWEPANILYDGADFTLGVDVGRPVGQGEIPFASDWDEPNPILDTLPHGCQT